MKTAILSERQFLPFNQKNKELEYYFSSLDPDTAEYKSS